jgi:hypothetical protein
MGLADEVLERPRSHSFGEGDLTGARGIDAPSSSEQRLGGGRLNLTSHGRHPSAPRAPLHALAIAAVTLALGSAACATTDAQSLLDDGRRTVTSVEIAPLEISASGADRFISCPPPGELGQRWIPTIPSWSPPPEREAPRPPNADEPQPEAPESVASQTERAIQMTHKEFRRCYTQGLLNDPTQEGHVALVLRVGPDGRVARVDHYGACELATQSILCMREVAKELRFGPPEAGASTIVVPAVFSRGANTRSAPLPNDAYTAEVYLSLEAARGPLHACEASARKQGRLVSANATFALDLDQNGKIIHAHLDPWSGDQDLLTCAAQAMDQVTFPPPPAGKGHVLARLAFNPRVGTN